MKIKLVLFFVMLVAVGNVFGQANKATVCHRNGNGSLSALSVSQNAVAAHLRHGDVLPGSAVPNTFAMVYGNDCSVTTATLDFHPFNIRNNNSTISAPWDTDMSIVENTAGDGFAALTPRGGQKVGYGTNFFDGLSINDIESADWTRLNGQPNLVSYLNIWVTDGVNYAVIASENDYRGTNFSTRQEWKVFETDFSNLGWLCSSGPAGRTNQYLTCNGNQATLADIPSNVVIMSPTFPRSFVGTGAPRGGYGFNLIWGDTQANFASGVPYHLEDLTVTVFGTTFAASN